MQNATSKISLLTTNSSDLEALIIQNIACFSFLKRKKSTSLRIYLCTWMGKYLQIPMHFCGKIIEWNSYPLFYKERELFFRLKNKNYSWWLVLDFYKMLQTSVQLVLLLGCFILRRWERPANTCSRLFGIPVFASALPLLSSNTKQGTYLMS